MDNTTTPRLVELVTRAQAIAKALNYIAGLARQMEVRQGCHKAMLESDFIASALSRLMADGGLSKEPLRPLGPEERKVLSEWKAELNGKASQADEGDGWHLTGHGREQRDLARKRLALLQANEVKRPSNPVDDGAVERAYRAYHNFGPEVVVTPELYSFQAMRRALEAAEPHP